MPETVKELSPQVQICDPETGKPTRDFLQWWNTMVREMRDHETRITTLEP